MPRVTRQPPNNFAPDKQLPNLLNLSREQTIAQFHTLTKQLASVDRDRAFPSEVARAARRSVLKAQLRLIGLEDYQRASRAGEEKGGGFDSSAWVQHEIRRRSAALTADKDGGGGEAAAGSAAETEEVSGNGAPMLRVLDVGAIVHRFPVELHCEGGASDARVALDVTSIDLRPGDEGGADSVGGTRESGADPGELVDGRQVMQADVIPFADERRRARGPKFDVVCLSLCVNFEGCARRRGLMLRAAAALLRRGGLVFLVLPRACVENSRYCDEARLQGVLEAVGLEMVDKQSSKALLKWIARRGDSALDAGKGEWAHFQKKVVVRSGAGRNNFAVCLDAGLIDINGYVIAEGLHGGVECRGGGITGREGVRKGEKAREGTKCGGGAVEKRRNTSNQRRRARRKAARGKQNSASRTWRW